MSSTGPRWPQPPLSCFLGTSTTKTCSTNNREEESKFKIPKLPPVHTHDYLCHSSIHYFPPSPPPPSSCRFLALPRPFGFEHSHGFLWLLSLPVSLYGQISVSPLCYLRVLLDLHFLYCRCDHRSASFQLARVSMLINEVLFAFHFLLSVLLLRKQALSSKILWKYDFTSWNLIFYS